MPTTNWWNHINLGDGCILSYLINNHSYSSSSKYTWDKLSPRSTKSLTMFSHGFNESINDFFRAKSVLPLNIWDFIFWNYIDNRRAVSCMLPLSSKILFIFSSKTEFLLIKNYITVSLFSFFYLAWSSYLNSLHNNFKLSSSIDFLKFFMGEYGSLLCISSNFSWRCFLVCSDYCSC